MIVRPPLISIITVVYNGAYYLAGTANSVLAQRYPHIEYIIVDGGSTDHTLTAIQLAALSNEKLLNAKLLKWVSEKDNGLYDAMNKGLKMATGDYVLFLNAGDELASPDVLEKMIRLYRPEVDVFYGETNLVTFTRHQLGTRSQLTTQKLPEKLNWESLRKGMVVCHQAFIAKRAICPDYLQGNLAADIDWVIEVLKRSKSVVNTQLVLVNYLVGGVSKQQHRQSLKDRYAVLKKQYGFWPNLMAHFSIIIRAFFSKTRY